MTAWQAKVIDADTFEMTQELQFSSVYGQPKKYQQPGRRMSKAISHAGHYHTEPDIGSDPISEVMQTHATTDFSRLLNITQGDVYQLNQTRVSHQTTIRDNRKGAVSRNQTKLGAKSALSHLNLTEIHANNQSTAMSDYFDKQSQLASAKHTHQSSQHHQSSGKQASLIASAKDSHSRNNATLHGT